MLHRDILAEIPRFRQLVTGGRVLSAAGLMCWNTLLIEIGLHLTLTVFRAKCETDTPPGTVHIKTNKNSRILRAYIPVHGENGKKTLE